MVWVSGELLGWSQGVSRGTLARDWDMRTLLMGTACLRVLAGERGDELLTSLEGISEYQAARYDREWCYKLAGGQHHRLNIQFACRGERDGLAVTRIAVERPMLEPAVQLVLQSTLADGANLGKGKFTLILQNSSSQELTNLLVKAYRGNEWVASAPVARLKGMANVPVEMELDLSTKEPLGEKIPIRFECIVDPHHPEHNGIASCTVNSMGRVVPMGTNTTVDSEYGPIKVDPKLTVMVGERLIFTDDGGVLNPYSAEQSSTLKFLPVDPKMKVRVRFVRIPKASLLGKSRLLLRWKYQTAYAYAVELDNIQVVREIVTPVKIRYEAIPAGAATFNLLNSDGSLAQENITVQEVVQGQRPRPVEVVPANSYSLLNWDDGATDAMLTSLKPVYTDATRRATLADAEKVLVALASMPEEGGDCQIGGVPARQQWVSKGDNLGPIVAMPKAGYRFVKWMDNGDTQASRTLISLSENTRLVAAFARSEGKVAEFTARDEEGNLLPGVAIALAGLNLTSGADGKARTAGELPYGDYQYVATRAGFLQEEGIISLSEYSASITVVMRRPATVNFTVTDTQGNPLVGARVQVGSRVKNTAGNGQVQFQLPQGSHSYTVLHSGYQRVEGALTVGTLAPIHHAIELGRLYKATFTVKHGTEPLPNAKLEVDGRILRTNAAGVAMIELLGNQNYPYKAEKVGYQQRTGILHVGTADASELVVLEPTKYDVVVAVTDGFRMLGNATITLGGLQQTTDANGKATYRLPTGDYSYTVQHADYNSANGNLTVRGETTVQITLSSERTVTFRVTDGVHPLPTAEFTLLDDNAVLPLAADGTATKSLAPGNYRYWVSLLGYAEVRSSVAVTNRDTTVAAILRKTHTVRFTVHDANGPVYGATIGIDGKDIMTDASGSATTELPNGVYPFTVTATGYEEFAGNITVKDADVGRAVELNPTFRVIFTVKSGTTNIRDAKIQISNQTLQTDSFGEALINLPNGTYTYSVAKSGFRTEEGQVKVEGAEVAVEVQLKQLYRVVFRVLDGKCSARLLFCGMVK